MSLKPETKQCWRLNSLSHRFTQVVSEQRSKIKNIRGNPPPRGLAHCNTHQVSPGILLSPSETHSVVSNSLQPQAVYSPWNSPWQNTGVEYLHNPGIKPRSPALHADSLAAEPQGKPFSVQSRYLIKALWNGALLLGSEAGEFCPWSEFKAQGTNSRACLCHLQVLQFGAQ